jgi:hypothetical protein
VTTGEKILISMKPSGAKWTGQIHDPDEGLQRTEGSGLRLRRHVLRRPDMEARELGFTRIRQVRLLRGLCLRNDAARIHLSFSQ